MPFKIRATCPVCGGDEWVEMEDKDYRFACVACHASATTEEMGLRCEEEKKIKRYAINIEWDTEDEFEPFCKPPKLPKRMEIPGNITDEDEISDYLSDKTGFCHKGFAIVTENEIAESPSEGETVVGNDGSIAAIWEYERGDYEIVAVLVECISPDEAVFIKKEISRKTRDKLLRDETGEGIWQYLAEGCSAAARGPFESMASLYNSEIKKRRGF